MTRVSIVVPVHNGSAMTKQCLDQLIEQDLGAQIVVVDDASTDDTEVLLETYGDAIEVIRNARNCGYAHTTNVGAARATCEYLVLLNNDTLPRPGWLDALVREADRHPEAAVFGAKLLFADGSVQHAGVAISQEGLPYHLYLGFPADHPAVCRPRAFQAVTAACMLVRRALFEELAGFDERYVNSIEDVDLCLRAGERGFTVRYCPDALVVHFESATRGRTGDYIKQSVALWDQQWRDRVRRDDLALLAEDGLIRVGYSAGNRLQLTIDPLVGSAGQPSPVESEAEIDRLMARWLHSLSDEGRPDWVRLRSPVRLEFDAVGHAVSVAEPADWSAALSTSSLERGAFLGRKVRPLRLRVSRRAPRRVNVVYEGLREGLLFGGHAAMLQLASQLGSEGVRVRILAVDQPGLPDDAAWAAAAQLEGAASLPDLEYSDVSDRSVAVVVNPDDRWIATSWWTMHIADAAARQLDSAAPLWLQQEYEPVFYPSGSFHTMARHAYRLPHSALFSSDLLRAYLERHRIGVFSPGGTARWAVFENPLTHRGPVTAATLRRESPHRLLAYLREAPRNMFEVAFAALELADERGWLPPDWNLSGVGGHLGERTRIPLSSGRPVDLFDRLSPSRYVALLSSHDVGVALQDSPHPGLVALDMAASGLTTVTTIFPPTKGRAELAALSTNILAADPDPEGVADAIRRAVARAGDYDARAAGAEVHWAGSIEESFPASLLAEVQRMLGW